MNTLPRPRPLIVAILDGWGWRAETEGNATAAALTPTMDNLARYFPATAVAASGLEVGLPEGVGGNSETGHRNIGAGKVEYQILASIDQAIANNSFFKNEVLLGAVQHVLTNKSAIHLVGLVSRGGVHAQLNHLEALLKLLKQSGVTERVYVHMIADGRDAPPQSGLGYARTLESMTRESGVGTIASVIGRFYAMDRNRNWERTRAAYQLLVDGRHEVGAAVATRGIARAYEAGVYDEKLPSLAITQGGTPVAKIAENDAVIFFNFRPDRARQLTQAFVTPEKVPFKTKRFSNLYFVTLGYLGGNLPARAAFREQIADYPLARPIAEAGLKQLHIAETEKYAHVTYYLNVGHEQLFTGEKRELIKSSAIANFADKPAMEAARIAKAALKHLAADEFDVYFINFANADMVGHTGELAATVKACEAVDECVGQLLKAALAKSGAILVTADHGNAEDLVSRAGQLKTEHTSNPVPFLLGRRELKRATARSEAEIAKMIAAPAGVLADVAPTILDILRLPKPATMTGVSLLGSMN